MNRRKFLKGLLSLPAVRLASSLGVGALLPKPVYGKGKLEEVMPQVIQQNYSIFDVWASKPEPDYVILHPYQLVAFDELVRDKGLVCTELSRDEAQVRTMKVLYGGGRSWIDESS